MQLRHGPGWRSAAGHHLIVAGVDAHARRRWPQAGHIPALDAVIRGERLSTAGSGARTSAASCRPSSPGQTPRVLLLSESLTAQLLTRPGLPTPGQRFIA